MQVAFIEWTAHGKLRHPRLLGVRTDKSPRDVVNELRTARLPGEGVIITHPEKVLFPDDGITKGELAAYYEAIAPACCRTSARRPVTMERYPRGIGEKGFMHKNVSKGFPAWLERVEVPKKDGTVHHPLVTDTRSLLWLANQNSITPHVWTSRVPNLYQPDICVFDLDPSDDEPDLLRAAALALRDLLDELGLPSWVKTSGSKGFHIVVPVARRHGRLSDEVVAIRARGRHAPRQARSDAPDAGVQQGRSRRAHLRRHRTQRLQRDVRRRLCRARETWRAGVGALHVGGSRARQRSARARSRCGRCAPALTKSATCGPTCISMRVRCVSRWTS